MGFLSGLAAQLIQWILTKLGGWVVSVWSRVSRRNKIEDEAKESVQPLKDAKTSDEIDKATDSTLGGL